MSDEDLRLLIVIAGMPGLVAQDLAEETGANGRQTHSALFRLVNLGLIRFERRIGVKKYFPTIAGLSRVNGASYAQETI